MEVRALGTGPGLGRGLGPELQGGLPVLGPVPLGLVSGEEFPDTDVPAPLRQTFVSLKLPVGLGALWESGILDTRGGGTLECCSLLPPSFDLPLPLLRPLSVDEKLELAETDVTLELATTVELNSSSDEITLPFSSLLSVRL